MAGHQVRFLPEGYEAEAAEGKTLLEIAQEANIYVGAICGGDGTCGKCRLIVREGKVEGNSTEFLTRDEIRYGYVLACQVVPQSDVVVEIPPESRLTSFVDVAPEGERFRDFARPRPEPAAKRPDPLVKKCFLALPEPTLDDPTPDQERLLGAISRGGLADLQIGLKTARELPRTLRRFETRRSTCKWTWDGRVTATVGLRGSVNEVVCVERGDTSARNLGLAVDVGTTTVVAHLVDLASGNTLEAAAKYNSQIRFGEDVVNRINYARRPGGAEALHRAVIEDVETLIEDLVKRAGIGRGDIHCVVAAGNTTMTHLLLGLEADLIRLAPFVPAAASPPPVRAAEVGLRIHPRGILYALPMVGSYVGGDITAGILASGMHQSPQLSLLLDIGTNGEVVLGNRDFLLACSASAGPAFEGASVTCGMRATSGAIDKVRVFPRSLAVAVTTIDGRPPVGLCGTGLIDALAGMFLAGAIDRSGRLPLDGAGPRFQRSAEDGQPEFLLVSAEEAMHWRDLVIRQSDIENLIRTKGAIYAAADSLVRSVGLSFGDVENLYIAGAFGNRLDLANCVTIGLLPDVPPDRIRFIGNSSVAGAKLAMLSRRTWDEAHRVRERITYRELMVDPGYMERFTSACFLPHTDLAGFPSVMQKLDELHGSPQRVNPPRGP